MFLTELGFSPEVVEVAKTTGDLGLDRILAGKADFRGKLMHYADDCVSGDKIVGYKQRLTTFSRNSSPEGGMSG